jgi:hypothetical protein
MLVVKVQFQMLFSRWHWYDVPVPQALRLQLSATPQVHEPLQTTVLDGAQPVGEASEHE